MKPREMTEAEIQRSIVTYLDMTSLRGVFTVSNASTNVRNHRGYTMRKGWPDITACLPGKGRFLAIEVKGPKGKLSEDQEILLQRLREAGALVIVARSVKDVSDALYGRGV